MHRYRHKQGHILKIASTHSQRGLQIELDCGSAESHHRSVIVNSLMFTLFAFQKVL